MCDNRPILQRILDDISKPPGDSGRCIWLHARHIISGWECTRCRLLHELDSYSPPDPSSHSGSNYGTYSGTNTGTNTSTNTGTNTGTNTSTNWGTYSGTNTGTNTSTYCGSWMCWGCYLFISHGDHY